MSASHPAERDGAFDRRGPSVPQLELDALLSQLVERANEVRGARSRLQALIAANHDVMNTSDLGQAVERVCYRAAELLRVPAAGLVLVDETGAVERVAHHGLDESTVAALCRLATWHGSAAPARTQRAEHPVPRLDTVLPHRCAPVEVPGRSPGMLGVVGAPGHVFSTDDDELLLAFATTAGTAVSHALLTDDLAYRSRWSSMLADASRNLSVRDEDEVAVLVERAADLAGAVLVAVVGPARDPHDLVVTHAVGLEADVLVGFRFPRAGTVVGRAVETGTVQVEDDYFRRADPAFNELERLGHALVVPFGIDQSQSGALVLVRERDGGRFRSRDVEMASALAAHVGVLVAQDDLRDARRRLVVLEERQRIAQDLHDHVVQRLFAVGLGLETVRGRVSNTVDRLQLGDLAQEVQGAIAQTRQSILGLSRTSEPVSLPDRVVRVVEEVRGFRWTPTVAFGGAVDSIVDEGLLDDVEAVVREALTNAVRHGRAGTAHLRVALDREALRVSVTDDGVGFSRMEARTTTSGLANMRRRAERRGGTVDLGPSEPAGATVTWMVPVTPEPPEGPEVPEAPAPHDHRPGDGVGAPHS